MKPDWEKIKTDYITGKMSQRELAEKYEVPLSNLKRRAVKEDWVKRRTQHETKVVTKVEEKRAGRKADKIIKLQESADRMQQLIDKVLADEDQFHRHLIDFGTKEVIHKKADTKAIRDMMATLKDLTAVIRDVYGLPGKEAAAAMRIARAKLKLDQQRAAYGRVSDDDTGVVFMEPIMEPTQPPEESEPDGEG